MERARVRKWVRRVAIVAMCVVALPLLAVLSLTVSPVRSFLVQRGVQALGEALPGRVEARRAHWEWPGKLLLKELTWTVDEDSLVSIGSVDVDVDVPALVSRDLVLRRIGVEGLTAHVPRIQDAVKEQAAEGDARQRDGRATERANVPFLRPGSLAGVPSVRLQEIAIDVPQAVLSARDTLRALRFEGSVDVSAGRAPRLEVMHAAAALPSRDVRLDPGTLTVDLQNGSVRADFSGRAGEAGPFTLESVSPDAHTFQAQLRFPERNVGAQLEGTWQRRGMRPIALDYTARVEASEDPGWNIELLRVWTPLRVALTGRLDLQDGLQGSSNLDVSARPEWFEGAHASVRFDASGVVADSVSARLTGLTLDGAGVLSEGNVRGRLRARCTGVEWVRALADTAAMAAVADVESVDVQVVLAAQGKLENPALDVQVRGALKSGTTRLDALQLLAEAPRGVRETVQWASQVDVREHRASLEGTLAWAAESLAVRLQPVRLEALRKPGRKARAAARAGTRDGSKAARVTYEPEARRVRVENLRVVGDLGDVVVTGAFDPVGGGRARATVRWDTPPVVPGLVDSLAARLRESWPRDFAPQVDVEVRIAGEAQRFRSRLQGSARLPGPSRLVALAPPGVSARWDVSGWDEIAARFEADLADSSFGWVDLGASAWIDSGFVTWTAHESRRALDSLRVHVEGLDVFGRLSAHGDSLRGRFDVRAEDPVLLLRAGDALPESLRVAWNVHVDLAGTVHAPRITASVKARAQTLSWHVPSLRARIDGVTDERFDLQLTLPEGFSLLRSPVRLDRVRIDYATKAGDPLRRFRQGALTMDVAGPDLALQQVVTIDLREHFVARFDSLYLQLGDRDLRNVRPFVVTQRAQGVLSVDDLELAGTMGRLVAIVATGTDTLSLEAETQLSMPTRPAALQMPDAAWPSRVEVQAHGTSHDDVRLRASLNGFRLSERDPLRVDLLVQPSTSNTPQAWRGFEARLSVAGADTLLSAAGLLPLRFDQFPVRARTLDDSIRVEARWQGIPVLLHRPREGFTYVLDADEPRPLLSGGLRVSGRGAAPNVELDARVQLPMGKLDEYRTTLQARGNGATRTRVELDVRRQGRPLVTGHVDAPLRFTFAPVEFGLGEEELSAQLNADSLDLAEITPLLPAGSSARGKLVARLAASGPAQDPGLQGRVRLAGLDLEVTGRRSVRLDFDARVSGTARAPDVSGSLRIVQARLRIPERENLLPTEGQPLLWETAEIDTLTDPEATPLVKLQVPREARVALKVDVPSGFWVLGRDLGIELKGDLDARVEQQKPIVQGQLEAIQGWFTLLGRRFELVSGRADFDGIDALNPSLDIEMRTQVKTWTVFVSITGDVEQPELSLRSEPEHTEFDIMSILVIGQPADQLDSPQNEFVSTQVAALAQRYSGAALQEVLGSQFGIDTVRFKTSSESGESGSATSLEVGKYLTPNVLIQYEIDLQSGKSLGVTMEYRINDRLKVDSKLLGERSGVELNWSRDY